MPKKPKKTVEEGQPAPIVSPEPEAIAAPIELPPKVENDETVTALPENAHTYYVFKEGVFIKFFTNEQHKGDAKKFAQAFADEIGGIVQA